MPFLALKRRREEKIAAAHAESSPFANTSSSQQLPDNFNMNPYRPDYDDRSRFSSPASLQALVAEDPVLEPYSRKIEEAGIDGELALLLTSNDLRELLPATPVEVRLKILRVLRKNSRPQVHFNPKSGPGSASGSNTGLAESKHTEALTPGELGIVQVIGSDVRTNLVQSQEVYALVAGLLLTVSSAAVFTPPCTVTGNSADSESTCTTIQSLDVIIWTTSLLVELTALIGAWCYFCVNAFLSEAQLRRHVSTHYKFYMIPNTCCITCCYALMPAGLAIRMWQVVDPTTWYAVLAVIGVYFAYICYYWFAIIWDLLEDIGGRRPSFTGMMTEQYKLVGQAPNKVSEKVRF